MTRVCFVSYEIHPTVMGGCGVLLYHAARVLLQQGHEVIFLLDLERKDFERFSQVDRLRLPQAHNCRAYQVDALLRPEEQLDQSFQTVFEVKSYRFYRAARRLCEIESPQVIEFFEYCGAAYHALSAKIAGLDFAGTRLVVRLHNTMELIDRQQPDNRHGMDRYIMYGLEHRALRLAESVLYPSQAFLSDTYRAYYGPWFGGLVLSPPALLEHPQAVGEAQEPDGILFYGRLFGFKGVDRFVDAAVLYLSDTANPRRTFYLAGYDSMLPPTGQGSYRDYLRRKIPAELRPSFVFTGQISWAELGELLPRILFAVIPSYLESFCYAAHELYAAGVPLVLTNLPAFQDSFHHGENALIFDGSVSDLAEKMRQLSSDASLRRRITRPYPVAQQQLAAFYPDPPKNSWINPTPDSPLPELLVCILVDQSHRLPQTLQALGPCLPAGARVVLMQPATAAQVRPISQAASQANRNHSPLAGAPVDSAAAVWLLGRLYLPTTVDGQPLDPTAIRTAGALLVLQAGDAVTPEFLPQGLQVLARQPQISYVTGWKTITSAGRRRLNTLPVDSIVEALPFLQPQPFNRALMRTPPGQLLIDLFDPRAGRYGELAYLWLLETPETTGLVAPRPWVTCPAGREPLLDQPVLDYLVLRDDNPQRKAALARFALALDGRAAVLRRFRYELRFSSPMTIYLARSVHWLATSRLSKALDQAPRVKQAFKTVVSFILRPFIHPHRL